jgi:toluene monooxygenase system ferredoxin subunit
MALRFAANLDDLWSGEMLGVGVGRTRVLLVHVDETVCAYEDRCAHQAAPLSEGRLDGCRLTCAAHGWEYDARTGLGVNPRGVSLVRLPLRIESRSGAAAAPGESQSVILVDVDDPDLDVGPVLAAGPAGEAVIAAIREGSAGVRVIDRDGCLRVKAALRCAFTREAVERHLGAPFRLPGDLERIMPSFQGTFSVTAEAAQWTTEGRR